MCISNGVGDALMSNAQWTGVPLKSLLEAAGPRPGVVEVLLRGADGYTDTIPLEKALDPATMRRLSDERRAAATHPRLPGPPDRARDVRREERQVGDRHRGGPARRQGVLRAAGLGAGLRDPGALAVLRAGPEPADEAGDHRPAARHRLRRRQGRLAGRGQPGRRPVLARGDARVPRHAASPGRSGATTSAPRWPGSTSWPCAASTANGTPQPAEDRGIVPSGGRGYHRVTLQVVA